jgi:hypothetical protein
MNANVINEKTCPLPLQGMGIYTTHLICLVIPGSSTSKPHRKGAKGREGRQTPDAESSAAPDNTDFLGQISLRSFALAWPFAGNGLANRSSPWGNGLV